ncbi:Protein CBG26653 [Caenorhabditis briggsae]|uniref:Protein CBG26653 n=2 Tax=Caenorhabditis briggsae TaxID=6238 RepID=B6IE14_CAEBR|nr:Protein CBG26653 [Caenorhabditis briggsae]CAS01078.1 Protein CBG26653 [Caenorhabditis briggsae]
MGRKKAGKPKKEKSKSTGIPEVVRQMENLYVRNVEKEELTRKLPSRSIKAILYFMDTSARIKVSLANPRIYKVNQWVPQRIQILKFHSRSVRIDDAEYGYQVTSEYPKTSQRTVLCGYNTDEFGNELNWKLPENQDLQEGDILIERPDGDPKKGDFPLNRSNTRPIKQKFELCMRNITTGIIRRNVVPKIKVPDGLRRIAKDLFEGGPPGKVHYISLLMVDMDEGIIRLPVGVKFCINVMILTGHNVNEVYKKIEKIIDLNSFPIQTLIVEIEGPDDPFLKRKDLAWEAQFLDLCLPNPKKFPKIPKQDWREIFRHFHHSNFHISELELHEDEFLEIVRDWICCPRKIGSRFGMNSTRISHLMNLVCSDYGAAKGTLVLAGNYQIPYAMIIPVSATAQNELLCYMEKSPFYEQEITKQSEHQQKWQIVLGSFPLGSIQDIVLI